MVSPASISSNNVGNLHVFSSKTSKTRLLLASDFLVQKFCTLSIRCRKDRAYMMPLLSLHGTGWNLPIKPGVNCAEFQKHALRATVHLFDAKEDKNVQQVAKSSCLKMSKVESNPKRLSSSASGRIELDSFQVLKYPLVTELAMKQMVHNNTLIFVADKHADKKNIKTAIKRMSGVHRLQIKKVNMFVMPNGDKKAYITLRHNFSALDVAKGLGIIEK